LSFYLLLFLPDFIDYKNPKKSHIKNLTKKKLAEILHVNLGPNLTHIQTPQPKPILFDHLTNSNLRQPPHNTKKKKKYFLLFFDFSLH